MRGSWKAKLKKLRYGVYTYGKELVLPDPYDMQTYARYNSRPMQTNIEKFYVPQSIRTMYEDENIEQILATLPTGMSRAILIIAPYIVSPLTALLLLRTDTPCRVRYTVQGVLGSADYTDGESDFSTEHRVPIVALFKGTVNRVTITIEEKETGHTTSKTIRIKMPAFKDAFLNTEIRDVYKKEGFSEDENTFYLMSGGYTTPTVIFDSHANVRGFLTRKPQFYGVYTLKNHRFLFSSRHMKRTTFGVALSVISHEMDWLGRYYHSYLQPIGFHHDIAELPDGNIVTMSSSLVDRSVENTVISFDRKTGEILSTINLNDLFDDTYKTRNDWCHVNSICLCDDPDEVIISLRNTHTICKLNIKEGKLVWILSHPQMYEDTAQAELMLTPEEGFDAWFFQQHSVEILRDYPDADPSRLYLTLYDNHIRKRRRVKWFDKPGTSYGLILSVDEQTRSFRLEKRFPTSFAITRSNTCLDADAGTYYTMNARFRKKYIHDNVTADMTIYDFESGELLRKYAFTKPYFTIYPFRFDFESMSRPLDKDRQLFRGELLKPTPCRVPSELTDSPLMPETMYKRDLLLYGDLLCIWEKDQDLTEIILLGKKDCYHIDFRQVSEDVRLEQPLRYCLIYGLFYHLLPMDSLPEDRYEIYVMLRDRYYRTDRYVELG